MMAAGSRVGHTQRRHPLCPHCGYDLVATLARDGRRCPECGHDFELDELRRSAAPGEWTPMRGLRNLAIALLWRCATAAAVWTAALAGTEWLNEVLSRHMSGGRIILLLGVALGVVAGVLGALIGRNLEDVAGFSGLILYAATTIAIILFWTAGAIALAAAGLLATNFAVGIGVLFGAVAAAVAIRQILLGEY